MISQKNSKSDRRVDLNIRRAVSQENTRDCPTEIQTGQEKLCENILVARFD